MKPRHLILDRDGVLNEEAADGGFVTSPRDWHWIPGALEALALLSGSGIRITVATNQSGVGRGLMSEAALAEVHARMHREAESVGARIHAVFACLHAPDAGCDCRKPAPKLITEAMASSGIPSRETLAVGDDLRDIEAARAAGVAAALVLTGKGRVTAARLPEFDGSVYRDLRELAQVVTGAGVPVGAEP
jgi:D-glycero-D-manno-heptose 1,7-bisphosphate phosphatase